MSILYAGVLVVCKEHEKISHRHCCSENQQENHQLPKEKADALNIKFESISNKEGDAPDNILPDCPQRTATATTKPEVQKMLGMPEMHKTTWPNEIGPRASIH